MILKFKQLTRDHRCVLRKSAADYDVFGFLARLESIDAKVVVTPTAVVTGAAPVVAINGDTVSGL
jgi:hypothetical protein